MKKYVLISVSVLLSMIYMYFLCDVKKGKGITYLTDNQIKNIMAYTIDNETVSEMPTKGSGYIAKSITCKNGSVLVWDNDNWKVEVKKLETYDTCNVDFTLDDLVYNFDYNGTNGSDGSVQEFTAPVSGKYVLEVWGAQGGIASSTYIGGYGKFISKTAVYCNDRSNPAGGYNTGNTTFYYGAYTRNVAGKTPTYTCTATEDKFTVDISTGNGKLTYPVALMTVDEIAYAGGMYGSNADVWFYTNSSNTSSTGTLKWWTMSPYYWYSGGYADIFYLFGSDYPGYTSNNNVTNAFAVRPVISLKSNVFWKSGDGSADNPFEIYTE